MTWQHLLQTLHDEVSERNEIPPFEAVAEKVRNLGGRLRMSEIVFPIPIILPLLERYSLEHQRGVAPATWIVDLFFDLGVAHESLYGVLESMFYIDEAPFHGANRKYIAKDLLYVVEQWFRDTVRLGGAVFGSDVVAERICETLLLLLQTSAIPPDMLQHAQDLRRKIEEILRYE